MYALLFSHLNVFWSLRLFERHHSFDIPIQVNKQNDANICEIFYQFWLCLMKQNIVKRHRTPIFQKTLTGILQSNAVWFSPRLAFMSSGIFVCWAIWQQFTHLTKTNQPFCHPFVIVALWTLYSLSSVCACFCVTLRNYLEIYDRYRHQVLEICQCFYC